MGHLRRALYLAQDRYKAKRPASEHRFIWSFITGLKDPGWELAIQHQLLQTFPQYVRPASDRRKKALVELKGPLTWHQVFSMARVWQKQPSVPPCGG